MDPAAPCLSHMSLAGTSFEDGSALVCHYHPGSAQQPRGAFLGVLTLNHKLWNTKIHLWLVLCFCQRWWMLHGGARSSDYSDWAYSILRTCSSFLEYRLIHFFNRCAPNITNPPHHCFFFFFFFSPNYSFSFKCKTTKTPNPKSSIHASIPAECLQFCIELWPGDKKRHIFA